MLKTDEGGSKMKYILTVPETMEKIVTSALEMFEGNRPSHKSRPSSKNSSIYGERLSRRSASFFVQAT